MAAAANALIRFLAVKLVFLQVVEVVCGRLARGGSSRPVARCQGRAETGNSDAPAAEGSTGAVASGKVAAGAAVSGRGAAGGGAVGMRAADANPLVSGDPPVNSDVRSPGSDTC